MSIIGLPLFLLTLLFLLAALAVVLAALLTGRYRLARNIAAAGGTWIALYGTLLVGTSLTSQPEVLEPGMRKAFCGVYLDCHLGVTVDHVERTKQVAAGGRVETARGVFYVVTVRVSSDARRATLAFREPRAFVRDANGCEYPRDLAAEWVLQQEDPEPGSFYRRVPAGDSFTRRLVFDLPENAQNPTLHITSGDRIAQLSELFLIGDEDSFLYEPTLLRL